MDFGLARGPPENSAVCTFKSPTSTERFTSPAQSEEIREDKCSLYLCFVHSVYVGDAVVVFTSATNLTGTICLSKGSSHCQEVTKPVWANLELELWVPQTELWIQCHGHLSKLVLIFYWTTITLKCCVSFCHTTRLSQLCVCICALPPELPFPSPHLTPLGHQRAWSWAPCAIKQLPTSCLFYTW